MLALNLAILCFNPSLPTFKNYLAMKYIDADRIREEIERLIAFLPTVGYSTQVASEFIPVQNALNYLLSFIDSFQQDETQVDKMLCSQVWWEEQGWIMIPPDATIEGIDSLLRQVRKKFQQEQPGLPGIEEPGIPGKDYIPVDWVDACEEYGKWKIVKQEQPEVDVKKELHAYICSDEYMNTREDGSLLIARHFYELGRNARKEE